jgi:hypothetical protein
MSARRNRKPTDPQEIVRKRAERQAIDAEISRLRDQGAVVSLDRARRIVSAYRASPFRKLLDTKTITKTQAVAAEKLCQDWAEWKALDGKPAPLGIPAADHVHVDHVLTDRMLSAGNRVERVLSRVGPMDRDLLASLVVATVEDDHPIPWRDIVRRVTGVTQTIRQSQMIVASLENLSRAYHMR